MNIAENKPAPSAETTRPLTKVKLSKQIFLRHVVGTLFAAPALIVACDLLLFQAKLGINLTIITALATISLALVHRPNWRKSLLPAGLVFITALLFLEFPGGAVAPIALFASAILALSMSGFSPRTAAGWPALIGRFYLAVPFRFFEDIRLASKVKGSLVTRHRLLKAAAAIVVPGTLAYVFITLFAMANPLIEAGLDHIKQINIFSVLTLGRFVFWGVAVLCCWAILKPRLKHIKKHTTPERAEYRDSLFLGHTSMLGALVLFNLMFAVQSALDAAYLWGGLGLPDGMTYAEYAHRGAYPLIFTTLLAAFFVLVVMRRRGPGHQSGLLRRLVYVWIGQNILLCISAIYRLWLYIDQYQLTELRLHAGAGMLLIMIGLVTIVARITFRKNNNWLWSANLATLGVALIGFSALDTSWFIANYNLQHSLHGKSTTLDVALFRNLGTTVIPVLDIALNNSRQWDAKTLSALEHTRAELLQEFGTRNRDWRGWTWREHRLAHYLADNVKQSRP